MAYYAGTQILGRGTTDPFSAQWNNPVAGTYSLIAQATDVNGAMRLSTPITVTVTSPPPPTVSLTSPTDGSSYYTTDVIPLAASASGNGGATITKVEFYSDGSLVGDAINAPYSYAWTTAPAGNDSLTAIAYDSRGIMATSPIAHISVVVAPAPSVSITAPASGTAYSTPATIAVTADATAASGATIVKVDFFDNGALLGTASSPPFGFTINDAAVGSHSITAVATDSRNATASSSAVLLTVSFGQPVILFDAGIDGSTVNDSVILISGTVQSPPNSAISVNGVVGRVTSDGHFFINDVGLQPGLNSLPVRLATQDGQSTTATASITRVGDAAFSLDLDADSGIAPADVHFIAESLGGSATTIEFDFDGNGTVDYTANGIDAANVTVTYSTPGLNRAVVRFKDASGAILYTATKMVHVYDAVEHFTMLKGVYTQMLDRLSAGDMTSAVTALTTDAATKFQPVFASLGSNLGTVVGQLGTIDHANVSGQLAELVLVRTENNQKYAYTIYLIRGPDGIWRVDGM